MIERGKDEVLLRADGPLTRDDYTSPRWSNDRGSTAAAAGGMAVTGRVTSRDATEAALEPAMARELHDAVLRMLSRMVIEIELYKSEHVPHATAVARLTRLQVRTRAALGTLREVICDLRSEPAWNSDFVPGVKDLLRRLQTTTGLQTRLNVCDWPERLPAATVQSLSRLVEEALRKAGNRGGARRVEVTLQTVDGRRVVTVTDDDVSVDGVDEAAAHRVGMNAMEEQAVLLGARLRIDSAPGRGTMVRCILPATAAG